MRAPDGLMARRAPGWPLAVTLGAHLLLAWLWLAGGRPRLEPEPPSERVFTLVPLLRPQEAAPPPSLPPATQTRPASSLAASRTAPARPLAPVESIPIQQPAPEPSPEAYEDPLAERQAQAQGPGGLAADARRQAGPADHALREGKPAALAPVESKWQRFAQQLEAAHKDRSRSMASESYTGPDGVTIYRFRRGNQVYCRTGGSVRPTPSALDFIRDRGGSLQFDKLGGEGSAGLVPCPKYAEFKRD